MVGKTWGLESEKIAVSIYPPFFLFCLICSSVLSNWQIRERHLNNGGVYIGTGASVLGEREESFIHGTSIF